MGTTKLYDPSKGTMFVTGLMSGSGSNLAKIIEYENKQLSEGGKSSYHLNGIFTDNPNSNAIQIARQNNLPGMFRDYKAFRKFMRGKMNPSEIRNEYDIETSSMLEHLSPDVLALGGYNLLVTEGLLGWFLCINVHPMDLSIVDLVGGKRMYTGDGTEAIMRGLVDGLEELRSTTHIVDEGKDTGPILMRSDPIPVRKADYGSLSEEELRRAALEYQDMLKEGGDWLIFPLTLDLIAQGRFSRKGEREIFFDGKPVPNGIEYREAA